jgi:hypothetical protein
VAGGLVHFHVQQLQQVVLQAVAVGIRPDELARGARAVEGVHLDAQVVAQGGDVEACEVEDLEDARILEQALQAGAAFRGKPRLRIDAMDFVARVPVQIPDPRRHSVRDSGFYSNAARGKRKKGAATAELSPVEAPEGAATPQGADRAALRRGWAERIRREYEVDPLVCPRCAGEMRVVGLITQPAVITQILDHLRKREKVSRPPPHAPACGELA